MTTSNANPTVSTTAPVLTDAVQRCVDTAAEVIATHREERLIFMQVHDPSFFCWVICLLTR